VHEQLTSVRRDESFERAVVTGSGAFEERDVARWHGRLVGRPHEDVNTVRTRNSSVIR